MISSTHLVSVRQKCVSRDFFGPVGSTRNMQRSTRAVTPLFDMSACSTEVAATNRGPDEGSDCHVLQVHVGSRSSKAEHEYIEHAY